MGWNRFKFLVHYQNEFNLIHLIFYKLTIFCLSIFCRISLRHVLESIKSKVVVTKMDTLYIRVFTSEIIMAFKKAKRFARAYQDDARLRITHEVQKAKDVDGMTNGLEDCHEELAERRDKEKNWRRVCISCYS